MATPDLKALVAQDYARSADSYSAHADPLVYRFLAPVLAEALGALDGPVLDVASGTGAFGRLLARAVAVDLVHEQLLHNPLPRRVRADAERLPFAADSFAAAASAFGIAHFPDAGLAVAEMARVAPLVGLLTWRRPEVRFEPKEIVLKVIGRQAGRIRTDAAEATDRLADEVGSEPALRGLLEAAGLVAETATVDGEIPWPGAEAFVDYRLSLMGVSSLIDDPRAVRAEAARAIARLPARSLAWRPRLVLGLGRRRPA